MSLINREALYEKACDLEAQALTYVGKIIGITEEWKIWSAILAERTAFKHDIFDAPEVKPEPQWIPCSERLPDEDYWTGANFQYSADVLMTVYNAEDEETIIDYGHTTDGKWYSCITDCPVPPWWEVLAWMPLPEPYKEGEKK